MAQLLGRMQRDKRLKSTESIPDIMKKIFPSPGVIDETAFKAAVDVADRTVIYQSVLDANTKVKTGEKARLRSLMADAASEIATAEADATGLTQVFGSKAAAAKGHYARARASLGEVSRDMNSKVTTDYNLDDQEVFLGGWANFGIRHMHLLLDVVKGTDPKEAKSTLIHEASHLADPSILDDGGYYGTRNFEAMPESAKVANAAHYEEIPRRQLGISIYKDALGAWITFTPGVHAGGGAVTWEDNVKKAASDFMQQAWDAAVDVHTGIRAVRRAALTGNPGLFSTHKTAILEISKLMDLTIHTQDPARARVTPLDVTLAESIAHGVELIGAIVRREKVTRARKAWSSPAEEKQAHRDILIHIGIAKYGQLLSPRAPLDEAARVACRPPARRSAPLMASAAVEFGGLTFSPETTEVRVVNTRPVRPRAARRPAPAPRPSPAAHRPPPKRGRRSPSNSDPLAGLSDLRVLELPWLPVHDLEPLRGLRRLEELDLSHTPVADLGPLAGLADLRALRVRGTRVESLEPLRGLRRLEHLDVGHTRVADLAPIGGALRSGSCTWTGRPSRTWTRWPASARSRS